MQSAIYKISASKSTLKLRLTSLNKDHLRPAEPRRPLLHINPGVSRVKVYQRDIVHTILGVAIADFVLFLLFIYYTLLIRDIVQRVYWTPMCHQLTLSKLLFFEEICQHFQICLHVLARYIDFAI